MRMIIFGVAAALIALAVYMLSNLIPAAGVFTKLEPRLVKQCTPLKIFPGTEDVTIDPETNIAFVSSYDWRAEMAGHPTPGGVYAFNVETHDHAWKVSPDDLADFQPHGLSLWRGANGEKRLFVINHASGGAQKVEIFDVGGDGALTHVDSVAFDEMNSPNDILAVGPRQFYVTNDRRFKGGVMAALELWFALPFSNVAYYDGENGRVVTKGLVFANGINIARDGSKVYVSEFLRQRVDIFAREAENSALTLLKTIKVPMGPDNIEVSKDGGLWVAGHPKVFKFIKHAKDASAIAPSEVMRIDPRTGDAVPVFVDTTGALNASSVGAAWDHTLIVGSVFDDHVMVCPMLSILLNGQDDSQSGL